MYEKARAYYDKHGEWPKRDTWQSPKRFGHRHATLTKLDARHVDFSHGTFYSVEYRDCDFTGANFSNITGGWGGPVIRFIKCSLKNATLPNRIENLTIRNCNLSGVKIDGKINTYLFSRNPPDFHGNCVSKSFIPNVLGATEE
jgi:hypothetical protein